MNGAREYSTMFSSGQYGRLYFVSSHHARGRTFRIYVLPESVAAIPNGSQNAPLNSDAIEVYGITGGQPGWTESYGWLHEGRWQQDFAALVAARREEIEVSAIRQAAAQKDRDAATEVKRKLLLANY